MAGVIAEYNPFHKGHLYHLQETRNRGATHIVVVMGGNFLQRGEPALLEKHWRATAALQNGADLILELPLPWAMATAQHFALGAISMLNALGVVSVLSFGSESGELLPLMEAAQCLSHPQVEHAIAQGLRQGLSYATARQKGLEQILGTAAAQVLSQPNNILGVEYIRQLSTTGSTIRPLAIPRKGVSHHSQQPYAGVASASWIRHQIAGEGLPAVAPYLPEESLSVLEKAWMHGHLFGPHLLERPLLAHLRRMPLARLEQLPDLSEGLPNRLYHAVKQSTSVDELLGRVCTKRYPKARIRRICLAAWLGLTAELSQGLPPYLRVLGFNDRGKQILQWAKPRATLPISHSLAKLGHLDACTKQIAQLEGISTDLYQLLTPQPLPCGLDYTTPFIKV